MNRTNRLIQAFAKSPFLWGLLGAAGFYALIHGGPLDFEKVRRYFTNHPVEYMETVMFSVGLAALIIKAFDIVAQRAGLGDSSLAAVPRSAAAGRGVQRPAGAARSLARRGGRTNITSAGCGRRWSTFATAARPNRWTTN